MNAQKSRLGRPKKFVDLELVERLAQIQCTHTEIASALGISVDTLTRNRHFAEVYKRGAESGRKSLRRMQFESALKGNVTMMIWLGKQYLGQSDQGRLEIQPLPAADESNLEQLITRMSPGELQEIISDLESLAGEYGLNRPAQPVKPAALVAARPGGDHVVVPASYTVERS